ncbi:transcription elongation factor GreA [Patescibacteria group bacterium]
MRVPTRRSETSRQLKQVNDYHLTAAKVKRLKDDLVDLEKNQRPATIEIMQRAAEDGDFSENAPYQEAKYRLRRINSRIDSIKERLKQAVIIEEGSNDGQIRIGSRVVVEIEGEEKTFEIVGSQETNPFKGRISHSSPLGQALLGHWVGDEVEVRAKDIIIKYSIKQVN